MLYIQYSFFLNFRILPNVGDIIPREFLFCKRINASGVKTISGEEGIDSLLRVYCVAFKAFTILLCSKSFMQNALLPVEDSGIITSVYHGSQTLDSVTEITQAVKPVITSLREQNKPVYLLIDARDLQDQNAGARKAAIDGINTLDYNKMAIFGAKTVIKYIAQFLIQVADKMEKVKYFNTEQEARDWLLGEQHG